MPSPVAVLFDMDGVIVDTNPFHKIAIRQFCAKYGFELSEDDMIKRVYGRTNTDWITNLFGSLTRDELFAYADEKESLFRELYGPHLAPVPGLIDFLKLLKSENITAAIATSAPPANLHFIVEGLNIGAYFQTMLDETYVTKGKPDPEIYIKTAAAVGLPNAQCIVIEDSLSGIAAGKAAGSKVIGITTTHTREEMANTDLVIDDFTQLSVAQLLAL
jgi:beta-phosphoglucomutase